MSLRYQPMRPGLVELQALRLNVGSEWPALPRSLVNIHAQPIESILNHFNRAGHRAFPVRIFNAQYELATVSAGEEPAEEGGADAAYMLRSCWTGRIAGTHGLPIICSQICLPSFFINRDLR